MKVKRFPPQVKNATFSLPLSTLALLEEYCQRNKTSKSNIVDCALVLYTTGKLPQTIIDAEFYSPADFLLAGPKNCPHCIDAGYPTCRCEEKK